MNFLKRYKNGIIAVLVTAVILVIAFMAGDEKAPVTEQKSVPSPCVAATISPMPCVSPSYEATQNSLQSTETATAAPTDAPQPTEAASAEPTEKIMEAPKAEHKEQVSVTPTPIPQKQDKTDSKLTCTLSVRCDTILNNMTKLKPEKKGIVPSDGVILSAREAEFYEGESVINVLTREMKKNKIHLEFVNVPLYNSAYIEGIENIYEHDCGELSGWMYRVNGNFPGYGASQYKLKKGDRIEWLYTCDMGTDIGGGYAPRNGRKNDN